MQQEWRQMVPAERAVLERIFELPFKGRDEARQQLDHCVVQRWPKCLTHCPSLDIQVLGDVPVIDADSPLDVYAVCDDTKKYGVPFEVLVFQAKGRLSMLEFVPYYDSLLIVPDVEDLKVFSRSFE